ncbi:MAG: hypothetical protein KDA41_15090, partial [Planctomycetales bacterium]|nr:hypothetical protein [Planctomycetales bacterium]
DPALSGPAADMLEVDEIFLATTNTIDELITGELRIDHVALRRVVVRAVRLPDGGWSASRLFPTPTFGEQQSTASIEDGAIELYDPARGSAALALQRVNLQIEPTTRPNDGGAALSARGSMVSNLFETLDLEARFNADFTQWEAHGAVQNLIVSPDVQRACPTRWAPLWAAAQGVRGKANVNFQLQAGADANNPCRFEVDGSMFEASVQDPRLPFPLTSVRADVHFGNDGWSVKNMTARGAGHATMELSAWGDGWRADSPLRFVGRVRKLEIDPSWKNTLPLSLATYWSQCQPGGLLDADVDLAFDGQNWRPQASLRALDMSLTHYRFAYPLTGVAGMVRLDGDLLTFDLQGTARRQTVRLNGRVENPLGEPTGWLDVNCDGPIPIDDQLLAALDTPQLRDARNVLLQLHARGGVTISGRLEKVRPQQTDLNEHMVIRVVDGEAAYENFPYPVQQISGEIEVWNGVWTLRNFQGRNDSGRIAMEGALRPQAQGSLLTLNFVGSDIALEDELRDAFSPRVRAAWSDLRPRGTVDRIQLQLQYDTQLAQLNVEAIAQKFPEQPNAPGQSISIVPQAFPYRLNQVEGEVHFRNGELEITRLTGTHGKGRVSAAGVCQWSEDGGWRLVFSPLHVEGLV